VCDIYIYILMDVWLERCLLLVARISIVGVHWFLWI
jgi:hypothetical protein